MGDEPTGNLDTFSSEVVIGALKNVRKELGTTVIVVTHDMDVASQMERLVSLVDGKIAEDADARSSARLAAVKEIRDKRETGELSPFMQTVKQ